MSWVSHLNSLLVLSTSAISLSFALLRGSLGFSYNNLACKFSFELQDYLILCILSTCPPPIFIFIIEDIFPTELCPDPLCQALKVGVILTHFTRGILPCPLQIDHRSHFVFICLYLCLCLMVAIKLISIRRERIA